MSSTSATFLNFTRRRTRGRPERRLHLRPRERQLAWLFIDAYCVATVITLWFALGGHFENVALLVGCVAVGLLASRLYQPSRRWSMWQVAAAAVKGLLVGGLLTVGFTAVAIPAFGPLPGAAAGLASAWAAMAAWRLIFFKAFSATSACQVALVGVDDASVALAHEMQAQGGYRIQGLIDEQATVTRRMIADLPVVGTLADLPRLATELELDAVIIRSLDQTCARALVDCIEQGVSVTTMPAVYEQLQARVPLHALDLSWFLQELKDCYRPAYIVSKQLLDSVVAAVGLAATLALTPVIALAIRLGGGPGPILYSQTRVGLRGREFTIYKFRTMRLDAEKDGAVWAKLSDSRVTRVGAFLRQTRLDELPQFWNVLKGDMSMVGPRPERPEFTRELDQQVPFYRSRLMVLPGVTGWAQVMFPYGASVNDAKEKLQYDLFYIKNRSFYLDLKILWKTVGVMAQKIGAR